MFVIDLINYICVYVKFIIVILVKIIFKFVDMINLFKKLVKKNLLYFIVLLNFKMRFGEKMYVMFYKMYLVCNIIFYFIIRN